MAWRAEKDGQSIDIILDGFEKGIAEDPYEGIADMRNMNMNSVPQEAAVQFSMAAVTLPPVVNALAFTATGATDLITVASTTSYYNGMAIILNSVTGGIGLSATAGSNTYFIGNLTATTFKLYTDFHAVVLVDITGNGSGTLSTAQFGNPFDSTRGFNTNSISVSSGQLNQNTFILDDTGQVWHLGNGNDGISLNALQFCGNTNHTTLSTAGSLGICIFKNYLMVFIQNKIDYIALSDLFNSTGPNGFWHIAWQTTTASNFGHKAISATDNAMYFCNVHNVGSVLENAGSTFDPATSTTYTYSSGAIADGLPTFEYATCIAQLGILLLIGGVQNYVYTWDRTSTGINIPLIIADSYIKNIVSTNSSAYIFAGRRGRIFITNGANTQIFKEFPDQIASTENPYYTWGDAIYFRNQLYFSVSATDNAGNTISNFAGVWAIDLTEAPYPLRLENSLSYGTYAGTVPVIIQMGNVNPLGNGYYVGWSNSGGGIDYSASAPYSNSEAYVDFDIVPVGTYFQQLTSRQIEYKLSKPLVAGESVQIWWRGDLTSAFTQIANVTGSTGDFSGFGVVNFEKLQWAQFRAKLSSTASSPSYVKLRELRLH